MTIDSRQIAEKHFRRNSVLGIINGGAFGFVDSIASPYLVLSVFVHTLGGSNLLVGLLPAISNSGWYLPQFLISHRLQGLPRELSIYIGVAVVRCIAWFVLTALTFLIADSNPGLLLGLFFLFFSLYCFAAGLAGTPFMDVVAKTIPAGRRGSYFGARDLAGALTAIGAGYIVGQLLNPEVAPQFPVNFGALFLITFFTVTIGLGAFSLVVEPAEASTADSNTFRDQLRAARRLISGNRLYRRFLLTRFALALSDIATPFYAIYATTTLRIPAEVIGAYIGISMLSGLIANPVWSRISDQKGNRLVLLGVASCLLLPAPIALLFGLLPPGPALGLPFGSIFMLIGIARPAANIAYPSYLLDLSPPSERSLYIAFTNTVLGIATFVPVVGGILLDLLGFHAVFLISLALSLIAWALARKMGEPRSIPFENKRTPAVK